MTDLAITTELRDVLTVALWFLAAMIALGIIIQCANPRNGRR